MRSACFGTSLVFSATLLACASASWAAFPILHELDAQATRQSAWRRIDSPSEDRPAGRHWQTAVYDPNGRRMLLYGGYGYGGVHGDLWSLSMDDGTWTMLRGEGDGLQARWGALGALDTKRGRIVVFGGASDDTDDETGLPIPLDAVDVVPLGSDAPFRLAVEGPGPAPRYAGSAIYDPVRDRLVVYGGAGADFYGDTWALELAGTPRWVNLAPTGPTPPVRDAHVAVYDSARDRMIVFGGWSRDHYLGDVWALDLARNAWSPIEADGPGPRREPAAIYDPVRDRVVFWGGFDGRLRGDVWELAFKNQRADWSQLEADDAGPSPRSSHVAVLDAAHDRMVGFGGYAGAVYSNEIWALDLSVRPHKATRPHPPKANAEGWQLLAMNGARPSGRHVQAAIYDPGDHRMILFGGYGVGGVQGDLWSLDLTNQIWRQLVVPDGPGPRWGMLSAYDARRRRMVLFGGAQSATPGNEQLVNDVWALSLGKTLAWSRIVPTGQGPSARLVGTMVYDSRRDRMIVFGGFDGAFLNDVWALELSGTPHWVRLNPSGPLPPGRDVEDGVYDEDLDRVVIHGGWSGSDYLDDLWSLDLATNAWTEHHPVVKPSKRRESAVAYDARHGRMFVWGGSDGDDELLGDLWELWLGKVPTWKQLAPESEDGPSPRSTHRAVYDERYDRLVGFGGYAGDVYSEETWAFDTPKGGDKPPAHPIEGPPGSWSVVLTAVDPPLLTPPARSLHSAVYDPVRMTMLVYGGRDETHAFEDLWAFSLETDAWTRVPTRPTPAPGPLRDHVAYYDPVQGRMVLFAGSTFTDAPNRNMWSLALTANPMFWTQATNVTVGPRIPPRFAVAWAFDTRRSRLVVYGGFRTGVGASTDLWEVRVLGSPGGASFPLTATGTAPPALQSASAVYDAVRDRMLVFGGWDGTRLRGEVWALELETLVWSRLDPQGPSPSARRDAAAVLDPDGDRLIVWGGDDGAPRGDVWQLSLGAEPRWSPIATAGRAPAPRAGHRAILDPERRRIVGFGGTSDRTLDDTWMLSLDPTPSGALRWTPLVVPRNPAARAGHVAVVDAPRARMIVFGGRDAMSRDRNDLWEVPLDAEHPAWSPLQVDPPADLAARRDAAGVVDPIGDRLLVFGGLSGSRRLDDLWSLPLGDASGWVRLAPQGTGPSARSGMAAVYDPDRARVVLIGGTTDGEHGLADVWTLTPGQPRWDLARTAGDAPRGRFHHAAVWDATGHRVLVMGGEDAGESLGDVWSLEFGGDGKAKWRRLSATGTGPGAWRAGGACFDPESNRLVVLGDSLGDLRQVFALSLSGKDTWAPFTVSGLVPRPRHGESAVLDRPRHRILVFGGMDGTSVLGDLRSFAIGAPSAGALGARPATPIDTRLGAPALALAGAVPNPAVREITVGFSLPDDAPARLELFTVDGRRIAARDVGELGAGRYTLRLGEGTKTPAGVYFLRLTRGATTLTRKVALVK